MARSFQLRIALLSALLSGVVSLAAGCTFLAAVYFEGMRRVDQEIRALGESQMRMRLENFTEERLVESLRYIYGSSAEKRIVFRILNVRGDAVYQSPNWPTGVADSILPLPAFPTSSQDRPEMGPPPDDFPFDGPDGDRRPPRPEMGAPPSMREATFVTASAGKTRWRFGVVGHEMATAVIGMDLSAFMAEQAHYRTVFFAVAPFALVLLGAAGWLLARRTLRPVRLIAATAERITARDLHERVPVVRADQEFAHLTDVINGMLERIERSFLQAARFSADAAHELKTPLTILQGQLEQAMQEAESGSRSQQTFAALLDETQRLKNITRKLLLLARSDAGQLPLALESVDLSSAAGDLCDDAKTSAPTLAVSPDIAPGVRVEADPDLLNQVLQNLLTNAIKFNIDGGKIEIGLNARSGIAELTISNTCEPIRGEDSERIFERFYRGDPSHSRRIDGSGLGLSLSREIARAHSGDLLLESNRTGWASFVLRLPLKQAQRPAK